MTSLPSSTGHGKASDCCSQRNGPDEVECAIAAIQAGSDYDVNFRIIFERYYRPVQKFFTRKGFSAEDSLDLTQETFLGIYRGLRRYRHDARFETWLYRIATTTYLKRLRAGATAKRSCKEVSLEDTSINDGQPRAAQDQLDGVLNEERQRVMREAVLELPEKMRKCLTLRVYHDLSYKEIAVVMKLKVNTVKAHLFQARSKLQDRLRDYSLRGLNL
jgi:RNA polymerase sigma-70 factor (ECF subfamily)